MGCWGRGWRAVRLRTPRENAAQRRRFPQQSQRVSVYGRELASDVSEPINLGSSDLFTIDALVDAVERVAGTRLTRRYRLEAPTGVNGRNSDNTLIRARLGWAPEIPLEVGIPKTYEWIEAQFMARRARRA